MNSKVWIIAGVVVLLLLGLVSPAAFVFFVILGLIAGVWLGPRWLVEKKKESLYLRRANYLSEIERADYYREVPREQLEAWVLLALTAHGWDLLEDPIVGNSISQGYALRAGKKAVVFIERDNPLTTQDLDRCYPIKQKARAETAFVISPFSEAPENRYTDVQLLAGKDLVEWMAVLQITPPLNLIGDLAKQNCSCGATQVECVSRGGEPLLVCSRFPDCQKSERPLQD